ncbi:hypothetical protein Vadar_034260 [Vaccinium darrowii]|uniref:Uncharacterized protein n=1 Tax=Vaccinium darrowii TaxID=229202 RepID=A0ACB7XLX5_9ERIC|nr:hypothetical protein Vadar_034260 [Vaccinium darrowii]
MASSSSPSPPRRTSTFSSATNYPFPSEVNVANFVPIKLGLENYDVWKKLMLNLIESHRLVGFVDGTIQPPEEEQNEDAFWSWKRSDGLVRGWIFVTVTEELLPELVSLKTAEEVWNELQEIIADSDSDSESSDEAEEISMNPERARKSQYSPLYKAIRNGDWENTTKFLEQEPGGVRDGITTDSKTALMLAVKSSKQNHFVEKLLLRMSPEDLARRDRFGQTALHQAAISGNNMVAKLLVGKNPYLPNIGTMWGDLPIHFAAERGNREMVDFLLKVTKMDGALNPFERQLGVKLLNNLVYGELYGEI